MTRRLALTIPIFVALMSGTAPSAQEAPAKPAGPAKPKDEKVEVVDEVVRKPAGTVKAKGSTTPERIEEVVKVPPVPTCGSSSRSPTSRPACQRRTRP
jgi:hypothetical protein